jgi:hypothetical protein
MDQPTWTPPSQPVPPPPAPIPTGKPGLTPLILGGIAAALAGLFLPWITTAIPFGGRIDITGLDTADGKLIVVGLVVLGWIAWRATNQPTRQLFTTVLLGLIFIGLMVFADYRRVADWMAAGGFGRVHLGVGLYLCGGGVSAAFSGVITRLGELRAGTAG